MDFDVFPWNAAPSEGWAIAYFAISMILFIIARNLSRFFGGLLEGSAPTAAPPAGAGDYRQAPAHQRLTVGFLPREDELWSIAFERGKAKGLAEALVATAFAAQWVVPSSATPGSYQIDYRNPPSDRLATIFLQYLGGNPTPSAAHVHAAALAAASVYAPTAEEDLAKAGFRRGFAARAVGALLVLVAGGAAITGGIIRIAVRHDLTQGRAPTPVFLIMAMLMVGFIGSIFLFAQLAASQSMRARKYLAWLGDATVSLRADVAGLRRQAPMEVGLAVAVAGISAVGASAMFAPMVTTFSPVMVASSGSTGSSCSSSSCGGGGGCG
jgi:hypothetical protein